MRSTRGDQRALLPSHVTSLSVARVAPQHSSAVSSHSVTSRPRHRGLLALAPRAPDLSLACSRRTHHDPNKNDTHSHTYSHALNHTATHTRKQNAMATRVSSPNLLTTGPAAELAARPRQQRCVPSQWNTELNK